MKQIKLSLVEISNLLPEKKPEEDNGDRYGAYCIGFNEAIEQSKTNLLNTICKK